MNGCAVVRVVERAFSMLKVAAIDESRPGTVKPAGKLARAAIAPDGPAPMTMTSHCVPSRVISRILPMAITSFGAASCPNWHDPHGEQVRVHPAVRRTAEATRGALPKGPLGTRVPLRSVRSSGARRRWRDRRVLHDGPWVTFPLSTKVHVNGGNTHPVFSFLKQRAGGLVSSRITWKFTKFLVGPDGMTVKRYAPTTKPGRIAPDIEHFLNS